MRSTFTNNIYILRVNNKISIASLKIIYYAIKKLIPKLKDKITCRSHINDTHNFTVYIKITKVM